MNDNFAMKVVSSDITKKSNSTKPKVIQKDLLTAYCINRFTVRIENETKDSIAIAEYSLNFDNNRNRIYYTQDNTVLLIDSKIRYTDITKLYYFIFRKGLKVKGYIKKVTENDKQVDRFIVTHILYPFEQVYLKTND